MNYNLQIMKQFKLTVILLLSLATFVVNAKVIINELHYNPAGSGDLTEFIEFYNTGSSAVDMNGWSMSDGVDFGFPAGATVAPGSFIILARDINAFTSTYPLVNNVYGPFANGTKLANGGERVALSDSIGVVTAEVTYDDDPPWATEPDGAGPSLELRNPLLLLNESTHWLSSVMNGGTPGATNSVFIDSALEFDTDRSPKTPSPESNVLITAIFTVGVPSNVILRYTSSGGWIETAFAVSMANSWTCSLPQRTEGVWVKYFTVATTSNNFIFYEKEDYTNEYFVTSNPILPGEIIINEIMYNSAVDAHTASYEYVELLNISDKTLDIGGCVFEEFRIPTNSFLLPPEKFAVIADKPEIISNIYGAIANLIHLDIGLANNGEKLRFRSQNNVTLSSVTYDNNNGWNSEADGFGPSLELKNRSLDLDLSDSWMASAGYGSPGVENNASTNGIVWSISEIKMLPNPALAGMPSYITAKILSSTNIISVSVFYSTNQVETQSVVMYDDGTHHDGASNDGYYGVKIPAMPDQTFIYYGFSILLSDGNNYNYPGIEIRSAAESPNITVRLSYDGLYTYVTPGKDWQIATTTGTASHVNRMYIYADSAGEFLIDDISITLGGTQHIENGTFDFDDSRWSKSGSHSESYYEPSKGYSAPGCEHVVAARSGGSTANSFWTANMKPELVKDGPLYVLSFAYKGMLDAETNHVWFSYHVGSTGPVSVCISEINYHPMHDGLGNFEYVELYNYGTESVDLTGWTLENDDNIPFTIPMETVINPGGITVICADKTAVGNYYNIPAVGNFQFTLGNKSDNVILKAWDNSIVDSVHYSDSFPWPENADGDGGILERISPSGPGSSSTNWYSKSGGTPGYTNSKWGSSILSICHEPAVPTSGESVTIYAYTTNTTGNVVVYYHPNESGEWQSRNMAGPDSKGKYTANIGTFPDKTYVPFYCELSNGSSRIRFPSAGPLQPAIFEIDNERDVFTLPVFRYLFTDKNWNTLNSRRLWDNTDVDGTLIIGTQIFYNVGIHLHGNYSRSAKKAFNAYLNYGNTYNGRRKVAYLYNWEHSSRLAVPFAQHVYTLKNIPVYDTEMITVKRRGEQLTLMNYIEPYDDLFLTSRGMTGNFYKAAQASLQQAVFTFSGYDKKIYEDCYELHGSTEKNNQYEDLVRGLDALYSLPPEVFDEQITQYIDAVSFGRERAMYHHLKMGDSWPQWGQNYLLYGRKDNPLQIIPQDIGAVGWGPWNIFPTVGGIRRLFSLPVVMHSFWNEFTNLYYGLAPISVESAYINQLYNSAKNDVDYYNGNTTTFNSDKNSLINLLNSWNSTGGNEGPASIINWNLIWISKPNRCVEVNSPYWYRATAFSPANRTIYYYKVSGPSWLNVNISSGVLSGTPVSPGSYNVQIRANDGTENIYQNFTVVVQESSVRMHLKFDENSGDTVYDYSANGNNGNIQNNVIWDDNGRYGSCLLFGNGVSDRVFVSADSSLDIEGSFTFKAWIKFTQKNKPTAQIFEKNEELGFQQGVSYSLDGGKMWFGPFDNGKESISGFGGHAYILNRYNTDADMRLMSPNVWHLVAVTHERDRNEVYVYIDGQRIGGMEWNGNLIGTDPMIIGAGNNAPFDGWIDEVELMSFARKAFNIGINIEAVRFSAEKPYIQFNCFDRGEDKKINLENYSVRIEPSGKWAQLPDVEIEPGGNVRVFLDDISGIDYIPASGGISLYPYEENSVYPTGNFEHTCNKILDYIAWGDSSGTAPNANHPAVKAGLWNAGDYVDITTNNTGRIVLKQHGRNDNGADSWKSDTALLPPDLIPVADPNVYPSVNFSWFPAFGDSYELEWSQDADFNFIFSTNIINKDITVNLTDGTWYWRVRTVLGISNSVFRYGNSFRVIGGGILVSLLEPEESVVFTNQFSLPVNFTVWPGNVPLTSSNIYIDGSYAGSVPGLYSFDEGTHSVWVTATTTGGYISVSVTNRYVVDTIFPIVLLDSPEDNVITNLNPIPLIFSASDNSGILRSQISTDGGDCWFDSVSGSEVSFPDGTNMWTVRTFDISGNMSSVPDSRILYVDTTPPYITTNTLIYPSGNESLKADIEYYIQWNTNHFADWHSIFKPISLDFSTNAIDWYTITNNIANSGSNSWITPEWAYYCTTCYVRIKARDALYNMAYDKNDMPFEIIPEPGIGLICIYGIGFICMIKRLYFIKRSNY